MESFDRFPLAGLARICLKNETKADAERDLRDLVGATGADVAEKARRETLLAPPGICGQSAPTGIGKVQPAASWRICFGNGHLTMTLSIAHLNRASCGRIEIRLVIVRFSGGVGPSKLD
jgi:hypothetical protein